MGVEAGQSVREGEAPARSEAQARSAPETAPSDDARAAAAEVARAVERLEQALGGLAEQGAHGYRDEVAQELRRLARRERRRRSLDGPGPGLEQLSARQRQVAELAAQGKKNREIAAELFVTVATVEKHLKRVFDKLGVSSRTAVAVIVDRSRRRAGA